MLTRRDVRPDDAFLARPARSGHSLPRVPEHRCHGVSAGPRRGRSPAGAGGGSLRRRAGGAGPVAGDRSPAAADRRAADRPPAAGRHSGPQRSAGPRARRTRPHRRAAPRQRSAGGGGAGGRRASGRRSLAGAEDRTVSRSAGEPPRGGPLRPREGVRRLQLHGGVRTAVGAGLRRGGGGRRSGERGGRRGAERGHERRRQRAAAGGERLRRPARLRSGG